MGYDFQWDSRKAGANLRKHGISFPEAMTVFGDPFSLMMADPDHSQGEQRFLVLGRSARGRLMVVAFAERDSYTRLISARLATNHERRLYEEDQH